MVALAAPAPAVADHVWIGGSYVQGEGVWKWSDGSPWNYTKWNRSLRTGINCVALHHGVLWDKDKSCTFKFPFVCRSAVHRMTGKTSLSLKYTKEELTFRKFQVDYRYRFTSQKLLNSLEDRMTGFRLSWFMQDRNGSRLSEIIPSQPGAASSSINPHLVKMVGLARDARLQGVSEEEIVERATKEKAKLIQKEL